MQNSAPRSSWKLNVLDCRCEACISFKLPEKLHYLRDATLLGLIRCLATSNFCPLYTHRSERAERRTAFTCMCITFDATQRAAVTARLRLLPLSNSLLLFAFKTIIFINLLWSSDFTFTAIHTVPSSVLWFWSFNVSAPHIQVLI